MNVVDIAGVTKTFGEHTAVDDLTLTVPKGSIYGFIGPNGSGKTTTLRMIMNILRPDRGDVRVFDEIQDGAATSRIGYLPEERGLYKRMKVRELLRFYGGLKRGQSVDGAVDNWLKRMDLVEWADKKVEALSKGMAQKVQFIASVVADPELVILDEPFTGLDPVNTDVLRSAVLELQRKGTTVIFSTHDMNTAERMCDFIFMIFKGKKVLNGTLSSIQDQYGHDTLRIRCKNGSGVLADLDGVDRINDFGQMQELHLTPEANPQAVAATVMQRTEVWGFEIAKPSLHDIFVRIAGPEASEVDHA
ncbi:MAG: ATP-binding cassette domain-containing protein [bacterium]|nr:ATP-binding cassette domain-containing protein [bacterium]